MTAYYNEIDPKAAAWLRELIKNGLIAHGEVDERSIEDVTPNDVRGFTQCHFFAGIGVWSHSLRKAGWSDDRPCWTGSCPCQPFSSAGKGKGFTDERHLWPAFFHLIQNVKPDVVFGEQVASKDGLAWLDLVQTDLEGQDYAVGVVDTCAAGFGAPHIRQRLYWVADSQSNRPKMREHTNSTLHGKRFDKNSSIGGVGVPDGSGLQPGEQGSETMGQGGPVKPTSCSIGVADTESIGGNEGQSHARGGDERSASEQRAELIGGSSHVLPSQTNGHWRDADWLFCRDGKWRPVEPSTFPLAHGAAARMGRLRGYGNAIVAAQAQGFIEAFMDFSA